MKIYKDRKSDEYHEELRKRFALFDKKGKPIQGGLIDTAIPLPKPVELNGQKYTHRIKIDFLGLSGTTFFDIGGNYSKKNVSDCIIELFKQAKKINELGIQIKIRTLFVYPYSTFAFSLIQAENDTQRSSVEEFEFEQSLKMNTYIGEKDFWGSNFVRCQGYSLQFIQELVETHGWFPFVKEAEQLNSANMFLVRFTPVPPSVCCIIINEKIFSDAYQFSKEHRYRRELSLSYPLTEIEKYETPQSKLENEINPLYAFIRDHYRYIWRHDLTMDCEDATNSLKGRLDEIKRFTEVDFEYKAKRLEQIHKSKNKSGISPQKIRNWKMGNSRLLNKFCIDTRPISGAEHVFISCCWEDTVRGASPQKDAADINKWLNDDFNGGIDDTPILTSEILIARPGDYLSRQIFNSLANATVAIIFLSADIEYVKSNSIEGVKLEDKKLSRPNIYHELGYLTRQLDFERVGIFQEETKGESPAFVPSNIGDFVRDKYGKGRIILKYVAVLKWLREMKNVINESTYKNALSNHKRRLEDFDNFEICTRIEIEAEINEINRLM